MQIIELTTEIEASIEIVFDLSRSIDLHLYSQKGHGESVVDGVSSGLIRLNESVTWEARHFGIKQQLATRITELRKPTFFRDVMVKGAFRRLEHDHLFESRGDAVLMNDVFLFESPLGLLGRLVDRLFLKEYMTNLLEERNATIKQVAESGRWVKYLPVAETAQ